MRDLVHCVVLAVAAISMAVCSSVGVWAASAPPPSQAAHQAGAPSAKAGPAGARGKALPVTPTAKGVIRTAVPSAKASSGPMPGKASPGKPVAPGVLKATPPHAKAGPGLILAAALPAKTGPGEERGKVPLATAAHRAVSAKPTRALLTWEVLPVSNGVPLVWDADLVPPPTPAGRDLGVRLTWPR